MIKYFKAIKRVIGIMRHYYIKPLVCRFGRIGANSEVGIPADLKGPQNIFVGNNSRIGPRSAILSVGKGLFICGNNCEIAENVSIIASNHKQPVGAIHIGDNGNNEYKNVVLEDDVWVGMNSTLLPGTYLSRGCIVGACSVCSGHYPPYAVIAGNPAKIIKFKYSVENILKHEHKLYAESDRLSVDRLRQIFSEYPSAAQRKPYVE